MKRMLITAAVLLTALALMLSAGCAKDKKPTPETSDGTTAEAAISSTSSEKMTLPSNISGTEIKRGEKYDIPLDEAVKQMRECSKGFAEYVDSGMAILDTGEYMEQDGIRYNIYALGTSGEDSFVREINVCFNHLDRVYMNMTQFPTCGLCCRERRFENEEKHFGNSVGSSGPCPRPHPFCLR